MELKQCETDTHRLLGAGAAARLANWQNYNGADLVTFVQRVISGSRRNNGWELYQKGGRSLEQIVIDCGVPPFNEDDILEAKKTLGLSA
jgi:hypothetical protein